MTAGISTVPYRTALVLAVSLAIGCGSGESEDDTDSSTTVDEGPLQYSPVVRFESTNFEGFPVKYYVPPDPVGLVWAFHGTNGSIGYIGKIETVALLNELIVEGFAFVATESTEQGNENQWDVSTDVDTNADLARLFRLREHLVETTDLPAGIPEYAFGFSNGGGMSGAMAKASLANGIDFRATAPHLSGGNPWGLDIPIIWSIGMNDPQPAAESEAEERLANGLPTQVHHIPELLVTPDYFTKNPALSLEQSQQTYDEMVRLGGIDESGERLVPDDELEEWIVMFEKESNVASPTLRTEEIRVAWSMHRMNAYYAREVRDFFLQWL